MLDKTIILVIITFIFVGILAYQQMFTDKGEVPFLARFIDRGGLAKMDEDEALHTSKRHSTFQFEMQSNLDRLDEKFAALKAHQVRLLENRDAQLESLLALTGDIQTQAGVYLTALKKEEQAFYDQMDEMEQLRRDLDGLPVATDAAHRQELVDRINGQLQAVFEAATDPGADMPAFEQILTRTESIVDGLDANCPDIEACLTAHLQESEGALEALGQQELSVPASDLSRLTELAAANTQQFKFLRQNVEATQGTLEEDGEAVQGALADLRLLTQMSEADFRDAVGALEAIMEEQQIYLYNLALHQQQFRQDQDDNSRRMAAIVARLKGSSHKDLSALTESCDAFEDQRTALLRRLDANDDTLSVLKPPAPEAAAAAAVAAPAQQPAATPAASSGGQPERWQDQVRRQAAAAKPAPRPDDASRDRQTALDRDPPAFYNADEHMERARQQNRENVRRLNQMLENYRR